MYEITDRLNLDGFSIDSSHYLIRRNYINGSYNTLEFFQIQVVFEETEITVEHNTYQVPQGSLVFISPGKNITLGKAYHKPESVYFITFSSSFYEQSVNDGIWLNSELFFSCTSDVHITPITIPLESVKHLLFERLMRFRENKSPGFYVAAVHNCIEGLLLDGLSYVDDKNEDLDRNKKYSAIDYVNRFRVLLQRNFKKEKKVTFYANQLFITPRRLSDMTDVILKKTAKQVIIEKVVSESVRMLKHSSKTIAEISYDLGFSDEANFSNFIKKHTQKTPRELREKVSYLNTN